MVIRFKIKRHYKITLWSKVDYGRGNFYIYLVRIVRW